MSKNKLAKRLTSITLLTLIGLFILGQYPAFLIFQFQVKQEIKNRMLSAADNCDLVRVTADQNNGKIVWEEENEEFHLNGKMYDVVRTEDSAGTKVYYCIDDQKENDLFEQLDASVQKELSTEASTRTKKGFKILAKIFFPDFIVPATICFSLRTSADVSFVFNKACDYKNVVPLQFTPPPETV